MILFCHSFKVFLLMIKLYGLESGAQYHTKLSFLVTLKAVCCFLKKWILVIFIQSLRSKSLQQAWSIAICELQYIYAAV